ncbi:MAG: hypothetical protein ACR2G6_17870 [Gemmatimonadaceae bacterium]
MRAAVPPRGLRAPDRFPPADISDIAIASGEQSEEDFTRLLLDRCVLACTREGHDIPAWQLSAPVLDALSQHMERLDPGARVSFALDCPQCATRWQAQLDIGEAGVAESAGGRQRCSRRTRHARGGATLLEKQRG